MITHKEKWIDPAVLAAFKAAIPAGQAAGDYDAIWPYSLWDGAQWVEFHSLAEMDAQAVRPTKKEVPQIDQ